jgi:hypothetical protein
MKRRGAARRGSVSAVAVRQGCTAVSGGPEAQPAVPRPAAMTAPPPTRPRKPRREGCDDAMPVMGARSFMAVAERG